MKLELLGTYGGSTNVSFLTSFLVDGYLAVDAGCLTQTLSLERQIQISDVLISHTHMDHSLSLPFLADNVFGERTEPVRIWATQHVIDALKAHIFNEVTWPDFSVLPNSENPTITFCPLVPEETIKIGELLITPVEVNHVVPTVGFIVECKKTGSSFAYTSDTTSTDRIWELANERESLKAVIVDCSFPNAFHELAEISGHNTPKLLGEDLKKLKRPCKILVYHLKPNYEDLLKEELDVLGIAGMDYAIQSRVLCFDGQSETCEEASTKEN